LFEVLGFDLSLGVDFLQSDDLILEAGHLVVLGFHHRIGLGVTQALPNLCLERFLDYLKVSAILLHFLCETFKFELLLTDFLVSYGQFEVMHFLGDHLISVGHLN